VCLKEDQTPIYDAVIITFNVLEVVMTKNTNN
jgi:hypothetical protein